MVSCITFFLSLQNLRSRLKRTSSFSLVLTLAVLASAVIARPAAAQSASTINISWPFPGVVLNPGAQVAVWGVVSGPTAGLSPQIAIQSASSGLWLQTDGASWGAQAWLPASIVDSAGQWRYLFTPDLGGAFNLTAQLLSAGTVISTAQTTFQVNAPPPASSTPVIALAWPTPDIIMTTGAQVAIYGTETAPSGATVSAALQDNQTGLWLNPDGTFGAQAWFSASIVDSGGDWRWLYTPGNAGSYTVVAQLSSGGQTAQASSTFSVIGAPGNFPLQVVNGTNGQWPDSAIWLTIIGQQTPGIWSYITAAGGVYPVNAGPAYQSSVTQNGNSYAAFSFQIPASGAITTMPSTLMGGRVYVSLGAPLYLVAASDASGITTPDVTNPSDPNSQTYWDYYEYTYVLGKAGFGGDTSQVDAFAIPINVTVQQASTSFSASTGFTASRAAIYNQFLASGDPNYQNLATAYRILSPRSSAAFQASSESNAMEAYIASTWQWYASNPFTLTVPGQTYAGGVQSDGLLHFSYQGTGAYTLQQPAPSDVWQCSGALAPGNTVEGALGAQFCAAFNRGVAQNTSLWATSSAFYQNSPGSGQIATQNQYAAFLHSDALSGLTYSFPYDDVDNQSSLIALPNTAPPSLVTLTIGW
jgi:hypothetical protein